MENQKSGKTDAKKLRHQYQSVESDEEEYTTSKNNAENVDHMPWKARPVYEVDRNTPQGKEITKPIPMPRTKAQNGSSPVFDGSPKPVPSPRKSPREKEFNLSQDKLTMNKSLKMQDSDDLKTRDNPRDSKHLMEVDGSLKPVPSPRNKKQIPAGFKGGSTIDSSYSSKSPYENDFNHPQDKFIMDKSSKTSRI